MAANFFARQEQSRRNSAYLIFLYILAVTGIVLSVYAVVHFFFQHYIGGPAGTRGWIDPQIFAWVSAATLSIIIGASAVKVLALRRGGPYIAESLGGRLVDRSTKDFKEKQLLNVVEEMAIASGTSVPMVYVLDKEAGINAFAAGYNREDAVVAVTGGCLERLSRDELQGVVGHEFSHILNGDMRLNIRLIGLLSGIMVLATVGRIMLRSGPRSRKGAAPVIGMGLALVVIGYLGVFFAKMIQCAVSRQREYLGDASAVQFTRNPAGLANALKKIGGFSGGSRIKAPLAAEASHMFFSTAVSSLFSTHPPLAARIRYLEPGFAGDFSALTPVSGALDLDAAAVMALAGPGGQASIEADSAVDQVGTVSGEHLAYMKQLLSHIPDPVKDELNQPLGASCVVYAMLLDDDPSARKTQLEHFTRSAPEAMVARTRKSRSALAGLDPRLKLPLLDLALPSLRNLSEAQYMEFKKRLSVLAESDGQMSLFEYCLLQIITHRLDSAFYPKVKKRVYKSIEYLADDAARLVSRLARAGHADPDTVKKAYHAGIQTLSAVRDGLFPQAMPEADFTELGRALSRFGASTPAVREMIFNACAHCVLYDRIVSLEEAELLRAIAYRLDLPMPPFLLRVN